MSFRNSIFIVFLSAVILLQNSPLKAQDTEDNGAYYTSDEKEYQPKPASFGKTFIGLSFIIIPGTAWYYYDNSNKRDQVKGLTKNYLRERFTSFQWKFDDNTFETNCPSHPLVGSAYYLAARSSGFNIWQSSLFSIAGSTFWEYIIEIKEAVSINDMIQTPIGGIAIGESFFQLAAFYAGNIKSRNFLNDFISDQVDTTKYRYTNGTGTNSSIWHNMYGFAGVLYELNDTAGGKFGINAEFFGIRNLKLHGASSGFHFNSPYTKIIMSAAFGKKLQEVLLYNEISHIGYSKQRITQSGGYSAFFSLNTGFVYDNRNFADFHDKVSTIHLLGPVADISLIKDSFIFRLRSNIFYDFAMLKTIALRKYFDDGHTRQDLREMGAATPASEGYYFAQGFTFASLATIDIYSFELGGEFSLNCYYSINGDGRTKEEPKYHKNFKMRDTRISSKVFAQYSTENHVAYRLGAAHSILEGEADKYSRTIKALRTELLCAYQM